MLIAFIVENVEALVLTLGMGAFVWVLFVRMKDRRRIGEVSEERRKEGEGSLADSVISPAYDVITFFLFTILISSFLLFGIYKSYIAQDEVIVVTSLEEVEAGRIGEETEIIRLSDKINFDIFGEVFYLLQENFPGFSELTPEEMGEGVIRGLVSSVGDPHTVFIDSERSSVFMDDVSGEFEGIGIEIGMRDGNLQVISPIKGTPADRAGLRAGDVIVGIDDESAQGITLEEAVVQIRGPKGEPVVLDIVRNGERKEVKIIRDTIKIESVKLEFIDSNIAHIRLIHFNEKIRGDFRQVAREVINSDAEKIILDLRGNPGGVLSASVDIAGYFIEQGEVAVIETDLKNRENDNQLRTSRVPSLIDYDVVLLIDGGSASASEIVAGAVRDQRGAKVVGENSFGKGSIQQIFNVKDGSLMKITVRYFVTPEGSIIDEEGIKPDFEVEKDRDLYEREGVDNQLQKAIEVLSL